LILLQLVGSQYSIKSLAFNLKEEL